MVPICQQATVQADVINGLNQDFIIHHSPYNTSIISGKEKVIDGSLSYLSLHLKNFTLALLPHETEEALSRELYFEVLLLCLDIFFVPHF